MFIAAAHEFEVNVHDHCTVHKLEGSVSDSL